MGMAFFEKVAKATGRQILNEVDGIGAYTTGAFNIGKNVYNASKKPISKVFEQVMKDNPEGKLIKKEMKKRYSRGLMVAGAGLGAAVVIGSESGRGSMGRIEGGEMANMTGQVMSSDLENTLSDDKATEEFQSKGTNISNHAAGGDIVLALHQLRKG